MNHRTTETHRGYRLTMPTQRPPTDPPLTDGPPEGEKRCAHEFLNLEVRCQLATHRPDFACYAGGVLDGVRFNVTWWPLTVRPEQVT
jgi:hypothetical protein